jgi:hypothetical protein
MIKSWKYSVIFIFLIFLSSGKLASQEYGNEWINYNQNYYKITLAETGIYRITHQDLNNAGFPVSTVDPRRIQLFHRGKEIAISVIGQLDAVFDEEDYIEFFGERNDGTLDRELYYPEDAQPHGYYNLYSDTSAYFLTWRLDGIDGKRLGEFKENNVTGIPAESAYNDEKLIINYSNYSEGLHYPEVGDERNTLYSHFDYGEGWTGPRIRNGEYLDYKLDSITNPFTGAENSKLEILLAGRNNLSHNVEILVGPTTSSLRSIDIVTFDNYDNYMVSRNLEWSDIGVDGKCIIRVQVNDLGNADFASVSYIKLSYTSQFIRDHKSLQHLRLKSNTDNKSYIEISQVTDPYILWDVTDPANIINIGFNVAGSTINAIVDNTTTGRHLVLADSGVLTPEIRAISLNRIDPSNYNFLMIAHPEFYKPGGDYNNPATAYAAYRSSPEGGNFNTLLVDIKELYNQYSYGEITPLAIYRFCRQMAEQGNPEYLLLMGRSLTVNHSYYRQDNTGATYHDFVPTAGYPGSDILFTAGLNGTSYEPGIPTGRVTAKNSDELAAYLDKLKETELYDFKDLWKKRLVHLSGGATTTELGLFANFVNGFKLVAEGLYLGGKVGTFYKQTTESVEFINIMEEVNNGINQITFFGHSGANYTDIDIGYVSDPSYGYTNKGRYPYMYINGCNAGNIFTTNLTFGEDWLITKDKGAIGVSAHSGIGYITLLKIYTDIFYATGYGDSSYIHKSLGYILQETGKKFMQATEETAINICQVQQFVFQGDPAVPLFGASKPDYSIANSQLWLESIDGQPVTALSDSFNIAINIINFGRADTDSIDVTVRRTLVADGTEVLYDPVKYPAVMYNDTIRFTIFSILNKGSGVNQFDVVIDPLDSIPELDKSNNMASLTYNIPLRGTQNLYPYDLSIVHTQPVTLIAQSNDLLSGNRNILFEIDTTVYFNSPFFQTQTVSGGNIIEWNPTILEDATPNDSTVYYWRTKFEEILPNEDTSWTQSSFVYIKDSPEGWAQLQKPQQQFNKTEGMYYDESSNSWKFIENTSSLTVKTFGANHPDKDYTDVELHLNGISFIFNTRYCTTNSINALAFDEISTVPYLVLNFSKWDILDRRSCGRRPQLINNFLDSEITGAEDYLSDYIDGVKDGDYVLLFSIGMLSYETWPSHVIDKLKEIGVSSVTMGSLINGEPIIILGKKGSPEGSAIEILADPSAGIPNDEQELYMDETISGKYYYGSIRSTVIGPAQQWRELYFTSHNPSVANYLFRVIGLDQSGNEIILYDNIQVSPADLTGISPEEYPSLRLYK